MSTTTGTDTFARFVELLAESLDDHETSGEALAACLHLSRFHFDRLVSAAAGEPPRLFAAASCSRARGAERGALHPPGVLRVPAHGKMTPMELPSKSLR